jgi:chitinase
VSLAPGQYVDFTLAVAAATVGAKTGQVVVYTDDPDAAERAYTFSVKAEVIVPPPSTFSVAAAAARVTEGNTGTTPATFTVTLTPGTPAPIYPLSVSYAIVGVTATDGADFTGGTGTLTFASASDLVKTVTATVRGDTSAEFDETFKLVLSNPTGGSVVSAEAGTATLTIVNDDGTPVAPSVGFVPSTYRVTEGNSSFKQVPLTIRLTEARPTSVTVTYATSNGTAMSGSDYVGKTGTLVIPAGQTQATFNVRVNGDTLAESDETFTVRLTSATAGLQLSPAEAVITIVNDDGAAPLPAVRVAAASVVEGNTGSPKLTFTLTLAKALTTATTLTYATQDGTAKAGRDYTSTEGTVTIPAGRTTATVKVSVTPNRTVDGNRTLSLVVRSGGTAVATGVGTIVDDDRAAVRAAFASFATEPAGTTAKKRTT